MVLRPGDVGAFYQEALAIAASSELTLHLRLHINAPRGLPRRALGVAARPGQRRPDRDALRRAAVALPEQPGLAADPGARTSTTSARSSSSRGRATSRATRRAGRGSRRSTWRPSSSGRGGARRRSQRCRSWPRARPRWRRCSRRSDKGVDVLYLVCHGAVSEDVPLLYLEGPDGTADPVDGRKLVERLSALERRPTVVMLCSCQSAGSRRRAVERRRGRAVRARAAAGRGRRLGGRRRCRATCR